MSDLKRCDICATHYDPPVTGGTFRVTDVAEVRTLRDSDGWDICSPTCLSTLASRRDPTLPLPATAPVPDDVRDTVHEALRWVTTNLELALDQDADLDVQQRLVKSALRRATAAMDAFRPQQHDDEGEG